MAYLGKYIRQILSRKEAVVLPGFGSLKLTESKGVQGEDGKIEPPGVVIRFDATHPKDDGRLAEEYAAGEQMEQEEARQQVLELVGAIKFKLDKGETYNLEGVGTFYRDDDNRIHFDRDPNWVIDPALFGLSSLDLLELENEEAQETPETQGETRAAVTGEEGDAGAGESGTRSGEGTDSVEQQVDTSEKQSAEAAGAPGTKKGQTTSWRQTGVAKASEKRKIERQPVNKWRVIWIVAGSLIVVLALILLIPSGNGLEVGKDGIIIRDTAPGSDDAAQPVQDAGQPQGAETDVQGDLDAAARESLQENEALEEGPVQPPVRENNYFIIGGSFQNLGNATELVDELKASGYPAEIILTEDRLYRVSVRSFATKQEALDALPGLKKDERLVNAWLLTR